VSGGLIPPSFLVSGEGYLVSGEGYLVSGEDYLLSYYAPPPSFLVSGEDYFAAFLQSYYAPSSMQARPFRDPTVGVLVL